MTKRPSQYHQITGRAPATEKNPNAMRGGALIAVRALDSLGLRNVGPVKSAGGGWLHATVVDRKTGEPRGERWVRIRAGEKPVVSRESPTTPKVAA